MSIKYREHKTPWLLTTRFLNDKYKVKTMHSHINYIIDSFNFLYREIFHSYVVQVNMWYTLKKNAVMGSSVYNEKG